MSALACARRLCCISVVSLYALLAVVISQRMHSCGRIPTLAAVALIVVVTHGLAAATQCLCGDRKVARQFPPYYERLVASTLALVLWVSAVWSAVAVASNPECFGGCSDCSPIVFAVAFTHAVIMGAVCAMGVIVGVYTATRAARTNEPPIPDRLDAVMAADVI